MVVSATGGGCVVVVAWVVGPGTCGSSKRTGVVTAMKGKYSMHARFPLTQTFLVEENVSLEGGGGELEETELQEREQETEQETEHGTEQGTEVQGTELQQAGLPDIEQQEEQQEEEEGDTLGATIPWEDTIHESPPNNTNNTNNTKQFTVDANNNTDDFFLFLPFFPSLSN